MDLKEEVRGRIAKLTRLAYERGYRDGAQSALAEFETIASEDLAHPLSSSVTPLEATDGSKVVKAKPAAKARPTKVKQADGKTKTAIVQAALQALLAAQGEARRDEILSAARAENPEITSQDLSNGLRSLIKHAMIRLDPQDSTRLLPAEASIEPAPGLQDQGTGSPS